MSRKTGAWFSGLAMAAVLLGSWTSGAQQSAPAQQAAQPTQQPATQPTPQPIPPQLLAEEVYRNVQIFKGKRAVRLLPAMEALRGLLGVECTHCHTQYDWANEDKPAKAKARQHFEMIGFINHEYFKDANAASCWTCHRGHAKPAAFTRDDEQIKRVATMMELPADVGDKPAEQVFKNIQVFKGVPARQFPLIMAMFSASLGVRCSHCHMREGFEKDDKPEKLKARQMLGMAHGILGKFYNGNGPVGCYTCHQGKVKPEIEEGKPTEAVMTQ